MKTEKIVELEQQMLTKRVELRETQALLFEMDAQRKDLVEQLQTKMAAYHRDMEWLDMLKKTQEEDQIQLPEDKPDNPEVINPPSEN